MKIHLKNTIFNKKKKLVMIITTTLERVPLTFSAYSRRHSTAKVIHWRLKNAKSFACSSPKPYKKMLNKLKKALHSQHAYGNQINSPTRYYTDAQISAAHRAIHVTNAGHISKNDVFPLGRKIAGKIRRYRFSGNSRLLYVRARVIYSNFHVSFYLCALQCTFIFDV